MPSDDLLDIDEVATEVGVSVYHLRSLHGMTLVRLAQFTPAGTRWRRCDVQDLLPFEASADAEAGGNEFVEA